MLPYNKKPYREILLGFFGMAFIVFCAVQNRHPCILHEGRLLNPIIIWNGFILDGHRHKKRRIVQNDERASPVDIPTGWNPRAKQSPTGALLASCGWPPFFESSLSQHKKQNALPGYGRSGSIHGRHSYRLGPAH